MQEGATWAIVLFPPVADLALVRALRQQYDPLVTIVAPHITLVFPFQAASSVAELRAQVEQTVQNVPPISVRLADITGAEDSYLFLNVKQGNDQLIDLHDRLYRGPFRQYRSWRHTYLPHVTVGRLANHQAFAAAVAAVAGETAPIDTVCSALSIVRVRPQHLVEEAVVPLTGP